MVETVDADNLWNVRLEVYVVGYPLQGESIVIVFSENNRILRSLVTDCYSSDNGFNKVADILRCYDNPSVDWFLWTHPHEDHSKGIPELLETFDPEHNAHIVVPSNMPGRDDRRLCKEAKVGISYLRDNYCQKGNEGPRRHRRYHTVNFDPDTASPISFRFLITDEECQSYIPVTLSILGPDNIESLQVADGTKETFTENSFSVVYTLDVNDLVLFMAADVNSRGARIIPDEYFKKFHFLKIPHHGSEEPRMFYNRVKLNEIRNSIGVTTVYDKQDLPRPRALKVYSQDLGALFSTHLHDKGEKYGCVWLKYNPMELYLENYELQGNAGEYK